LLSCKDACENVTEYLDGETTVVQRLSMRFHLLLCKNCRTFFRQFQIVIGTAAKISAAPAPTDAEIDSLVARLAAVHKEQS
jgi:predicted anti-sigma-YlaC factor YlaD